MKTKYRGRFKILLVFGILFLLVSVLLTLIFLEGKKTYTVEFDLDGGTLLGGSLEQRVMQGQDAIPPAVVKDGAYLRGWSTSYRRITKDVVIKAIWEYETTAGIVYTNGENQNYVEIERAYEFLRGEVYLGAYFNEKKVLGILDGAFFNQKGITRVYLLNGLISIGNEAFSGCSALTKIEIPETVTRIGKYAFRDCYDLEELTLNEGLLSIGERAFEDCVALTEVFIPESVRAAIILLSKPQFRRRSGLQVGLTVGREMQLLNLLSPKRKKKSIPRKKTKRTGGNQLCI